MFLFAMLLFEGEFIGGWADIKLITAIGLMINNPYFIGIAMIVIMVFGIVYKIAWKFVLKRHGIDRDVEVPFIPCILFSYLTIYLLGSMI